jgi:hypothetical protein
MVHPTNGMTSTVASLLRLAAQPRQIGMQPGMVKVSNRIEKLLRENHPSTSPGQ